MDALAFAVLSYVYRRAKRYRFKRGVPIDEIRMVFGEDGEGAVFDLRSEGLVYTKKRKLLYVLPTRKGRELVEGHK